MPKVESAVPVPQKPKSKPKQDGVPREILYPELKLYICHGDGSQKVQCETRPAITAAKMREIMGWLPEPKYTKWRMGLDPTLKEEDAKFPKDDVVPVLDEEGHPVLDANGKPIITVVLLRDEEGNKVICTNNCCNRPFIEEIGRKYAQDTLNRNWAGPTTLPGETINCETFVIGRTGQVISGQHRGIGLILAAQMWRKSLETNGHWSVLWPKEQYPNGPVLDVPIFFGCSEDPRVIRTLDNVRPRTTSDTVYTSPIFAGMKPQDKLTCAKMMDHAVDLLWQRTEARDTPHGKQYQTHSASLDFIERHDKLKKCVEHLFRCNKAKQITNLVGSAGACAAAMYLMATSCSDLDAYRNAEPEPNEKVLDFSCWEKAKHFWTDIKEDEGNAAVIRQAMAKLIAVEEDGDTVRLSEKLCLIAKAWEVYSEGTVEAPGQVAPSQLSLDDCYLQDENGKWHLGPDAPTFGGIDCGLKIKKTEVTPEQAEAAKTEIDQERRQRLEREKEEKVEAQRAKKAGTGGFADWVPPKTAANNRVVMPSEAASKSAPKPSGKPAAAANPESEKTPAAQPEAAAAPQKRPSRGHSGTTPRPSLRGGIG